VQQVKFPAGFKLLPHWHPEDVRTLIVLSGTLYDANGEQWDQSKLKPFPPGTFFSEPPRFPITHGHGEVVLHLTGTGPTGATNRVAKERGVGAPMHLRPDMETAL